MLEVCYDNQDAESWFPPKYSIIIMMSGDVTDYNISVSYMSETIICIL